MYTWFSLLQMPTWLRTWRRWRRSWRQSYRRRRLCTGVCSPPAPRVKSLTVWLATSRWLGADPAQAHATTSLWRDQPCLTWDDHITVLHIANEQIMHTASLWCCAWGIFFCWLEQCVECMLMHVLIWTSIELKKTSRRVQSAGPTEHLAKAEKR